MKLYIENEKRLKNDTLYSFLLRNLKIKGHWSNRCKFNATYYDPEFKTLQQLSSKRSFEEIVLISKTYFKISDKSVAKVIIRILNEYNNLSLVLCDTAKKWVVNEGLTKHENSKYCANYNNGFSKRDEEGHGKYTYNDILVLAGLPKENDNINNNL